MNFREEDRADSYGPTTNKKTEEGRLIAPRPAPQMYRCEHPYCGVEYPAADWCPNGHGADTWSDVMRALKEAGAGRPSASPRCDGVFGSLSHDCEREAGHKGACGWAALDQQKAEVARPSASLLHEIGVLAMTAQSDPHAEASVYRQALIDICNLALKAQSTDVARPSASRDLQTESEALETIFRSRADWSPVERARITSALDTLRWALGELGILNPARLAVMK